MTTYAYQHLAALVGDQPFWKHPAGDLVLIRHKKAITAELHINYAEWRILTVWKEYDHCLHPQGLVVVHQMSRTKTKNRLNDILPERWRFQLGPWDKGLTMIVNPEIGWNDHVDCIASKTSFYVTNIF